MIYLFISVLAVSCSKASPPPSSVGSQDQLDLSSEILDGPPTLTAPETQTPTVSMKPSKAETQSLESRLSPASSLGGQDRRLVLKPFSVISASDFVAGALIDDSLEPGLAKTLRVLKASLSTGTLPFEVFGARASSIARIMYDQESLEGIYTARCAKPEKQSEDVASVVLRVFAHRDGETVLESKDVRSAMGLAILARNEDGIWLIEHFELDCEALKTPIARSKPWDPFD